jgi:uroporphyrinogen-III decarboxylase
MKPAREAGVIIHMHSDGEIRELIDDIIEGGVDIINLQDNVNGIDWIAGRFSGRTCVEIDIDRQQITVFGTPKEIDNHIARIVKTIGSPQGGLMMIFGLYPGTPVGNIRALMDAMEKYSG